MNIKSNNKSVNIRLNNLIAGNKNYNVDNNVNNTDYEEIDYNDVYNDNNMGSITQSQIDKYPKSIFDYIVSNDAKLPYKLPVGVVSHTLKNIDKLFDESVYKKYNDLYKENAKAYPHFARLLTNKMTQFNLIDEYIPQGVCNVFNNTIISCYDGNKENSNNSMLMVIDSLGNTKNLYLSDENGDKLTSHVGGIAYDDINNLLWVTGSDGKIYSFNYNDIARATSDSYITPINCTSLDITNESGSKVASYMTYFEGKLYVGSFNENEKGIVKEYYIGDNGSTLSEQSVFTVPRKTQGISFYKDVSNQVYMACACSYGRKNSSYLHIYGINDGSFDEKNVFQLPPMIEQVTFDKDGLLQCVFESGAKAYNLEGYNAKKENSIVELQTVVNLDIFNNIS